MRLLRLLLLSVLLPAASLAKEDYFSYFNSEAFWQRLILDDATMPLLLSSRDTAIIVASNRAEGTTRLRFMGEQRRKGEVRYFVVYTRGTNWHVHPVSSLRSGLEALPSRGKDWVVYTEGMGKIFTADLDRGIAMASQYGVNVLLLDYPSICSKYKAYRNYRFVMRNSRIAYRDFADVLDSMRMLRRPGATGKGALTMFFHSMGNNVLMKIARSKYLERYNDTVWVDNIIMNAPCVPYRKSAKWIDSVHFAKHIYVHYNPADRTLKWARIIGFRRILGERPRAHIANNATYINFNPLCGDGHSNFLSLNNRPAANCIAVAHYEKLFHGKPAFDTVTYRASAYRRIGYDLVAGHP